MTPDPHAPPPLHQAYRKCQAAQATSALWLERTELALWTMVGFLGGVVTALLLVWP